MDKQETAPPARATETTQQIDAGPNSGAEAARRSREAEAAHKLEKEKQQAEAPQKLVEEKQQAEAAQKLVEEKQQAEAAQKLVEEKQQAEKLTRIAEEAAARQREEQENAKKTEELRNRSIRELKTTLEEHRRRYNKGKNLWRVWFLLTLHILILSIAGTIFVNWSATLNATDSSVAREVRSDIVHGLLIVAVVSLFLGLEYLRNWWNFKVRSNQVDQLIVDLTKPDADLNVTRTELRTIIDRRSFIQN
jgi:chemotaxis protein histidine kinase CheA